MRFFVGYIYDIIMKTFMLFFIFFIAEGFMETKKEVYEKPIAEIIEFELNDNIAMSTDMGPGLACSEGLFW